MKHKLKRVILYARQHRANERVHETLKRLADCLLAQHLEVFVDADTKASFDLGLPLLARSKMDNKQDLIIVVGGDGSILSAARMAIGVGLPVIGINRGRLGFLTDISPEQMEEALKRVLDGDYKEESRFLLSTRIHDEETVYFQGDALNDVVLSRGNETHLVEFEVLIDKQPVGSFRADGIIIATPTGSTAYALSAGGPIMHPKLDALVLVPMFSHSLSSRPIVVHGSSEIDLRISERNEHDLRISCDGNESRLVKNGQIVSIVKNSKALRLLHPSDYHYYDRLREKLGWESRFQG